jgi:PIN domain nuclease of toxin-antitoxin system
VSDGQILDACALIAYYKGETGADAVETLLEQAVFGETKLCMSKINLLEVYYGFYRDDGAEKAEEILQKTLALPITIIDDLDDAVFREAGRLKASYDISFADSFVLGYALALGISLITADHNEFDVIETKENITFNWIR